MRVNPGPRSLRRTRHDEPTALDRAALAARYRSVRDASVRLAAPLSAEDCCAQSMPDASPTKWHLAHTTWFFETFLLERADARHEPFHPAFRVLFNSYYNAVGEQHPRPRRGLLTRPGLDAVHAYRRHVDARMEEGIASGALEPLADLVELGLQHEQQHQELILSDAKHLLAASPLRPAYRDDLAAPPRRPAPPLRWQRHEAGLRAIGSDGAGFCFDNETPRHTVFVHAFELASRPVTNREFLAFVEADGYARPEWWLSDGFATACAEGWRAPSYWERRDGAWLEFTLGGLRPLDLDAPVSHVSGYEADAFARFAGARLPTEAEWEFAAAAAPVRGNFADAGLLHPAPAPPEAGSAPAQLFGDVWEWTQSPYVAYPGFRPAPGAVGEYNGKFMCNQLVLRGGSCATPAGHVRASYRNFFPPGARWQWSGLRLARDAR
ncbi:MAG: ergothioneine biosynthesis protein EgtB [Proteobacteria bacterium]|nr:MAG: ergothioneine biosynthesis protein EgtB [Pseudomonadota bacterium]